MPYGMFGLVCHLFSTKQECFQHIVRPASTKLSSELFWSHTFHPTHNEGGYLLLQDDALYYAAVLDAVLTIRI